MFAKRLSVLTDASSEDQMVVDPLIFQSLSQNFDEVQIFAELKEKLILQPISFQSDTYKDLIRYLKTLICYPSTEKAQFHREANRLGKFDIEKEASSLAKSIRHVNKFVKQINNCQCCGLVKQEEELKICSNSFKDVASVGISTYMFYITMIHLSYLLLMALLIFGIFGLVSNIRTSQIWNSKGKQQQDFSNSLMISLGSKICLAIYEKSQDQDLLIYQVWLGLALVVSFIFAYLFMEHKEVTQVRNIELLDKSASDFTVVIEGVPPNVTKEEIQTEIKRILNENAINQQNTESIEQIDHNYLIAKINVGIPKDYQQIQSNSDQSKEEKILNKQKKFKRKIVSYIMELTQSAQFKTPVQVRNETETQFINFRTTNEIFVNNDFTNFIRKLGPKQNSIHIMKLLKNVNIEDAVSKKEISDELREQKKSQIVKGNVFVTFESRKVKQKVLKLMQKNVLDKFLNYLTLNLYQKKFPIFLSGIRYKARIQQASEPEDVIWGNIGNFIVKKGTKPKQLFIRKCATFLITFVILGASFITTYGLSTVQIRNQDNRYISILISLCLSLFNFVILYALRVLTSYELSVTQTDYQSSLAVKSIIAQLVNTIVIPILVNRFLKNKDYLYEKSGLAEDVFLLGITNSFLGPLLKIMDFNYFFMRHFNVWYNERPKKKFYLSQIQLNEIYELQEFQNGIEYVYIISLYLFTMFFMSLQPIIIVFAILGYLMNYWTQKYCLFHRCKRPVPGTRILYDTMVQFIYAGGLFYSVGSLSFVNLIPEDVFQNRIDPAFIVNLIAVGVSVISLFIPFSLLYEILFRKPENGLYEQDQLFSKDRIFLLSEYDRTNPTTRESAVLEYIKFVNRKKKEIRRKNKSEKAKFLKIFNRQSRRKSCFQRQSNFVPYNFSQFRRQSQSPLHAVSPGAMQNFILSDMTKAVNEDINRFMEEMNNLPENEALDTAVVTLKFKDFINEQQNFELQGKSQTEFYTVEGSIAVDIK